MSLAAFGVRKPVPVNLLMAGLIIAGLFAATSLRRQFFPDVNAESAIVSLVYPGAAPEEVEEALAIKVEDALVDLDEVDELRSVISEGGGGITVEFVEGEDPDEALREVERRIDALQDLPAEAERITVALLEPTLPVIMVAVFGDLPERVLKEAVRSVRDDLRDLPEMGQVQVGGVRPYEVRVDVRQAALIEQGVALTDVSRAIEQAMREVPGGTVKNRGGNVSVRTMGVEERASAIEQVVVKAFPDGRVVRLDQVAEVTETFSDDAIINRYDAMPAAFLTVFKVGDQDIVSMAEMVRGYIAARRGEPFPGSWLERHRSGSPLARGYAKGLDPRTPLPTGAQVAKLTDLARFVEGRLDLLTRNAVAGAVLVFATLLIFLNWRAALWVGVGLVTALGGTLLLMAVTGITLNLLTMFGLIVVLGLLVDDAIVVSENIVARHDAGEPPLTAAINGASQVSWPVVATVTTTVVAFLPLTFIKGTIGDLLGALPYVVACALLMSLVESLLILPSHMGHSLAKRDRQTHISGVAAALRRFERWRDHLIADKVIPAYTVFLRRSLRYRYISSAVMLAVMIGSFGLVAGRHVPFEFLSESDAETVVINLRLPVGAPLERTTEVVSRIERAALAIPETDSVAVNIGTQDDLDTGQSGGFASHIAQLYLELTPVELRDRPSPEIIGALRASLDGQLDDIDRITFEPISGGPGGPDISVRLSGPDPDALVAAAAELKRELLGFAGVVDVADDNDRGQQEQRIVPRDADLLAAGLTRAELALQLRGFLFGLDAHVFAQDEEDIDVRVRIDEATRRSLDAVEHAWVVNSAGRAVPLREVADVVPSSAYASIKRVDRQRAITVTADTEFGVSPEDVVRELDLAAFARSHPGIKVGTAGRQEQVADAFSTLPIGAGAAALMIYCILAWLFSSYFQPLVVMAVIPFAIIGAIWGHLVMGYSMTFLSLIGLIALAGIVVNDSLIYVEFFNLRRAEGVGVFEALVDAGRARLRAIFLTTATTVLGLTPLMLEQSFQARFLIPMAISICAGLLVATVLILALLPCFMLILDDVGRGWHWLWHGKPRPHPAIEPHPTGRHASVH